VGALHFKCNSQMSFWCFILNVQDFGGNFSLVLSIELLTYSVAWSLGLKLYGCTEGILIVPKWMNGAFFWMSKTLGVYFFWCFQLSFWPIQSFKVFLFDFVGTLNYDSKGFFFFLFVFNWTSDLFNQLGFKSMIMWVHFNPIELPKF